MLPACENTVDPLTEDDGGAFALFGFLDTGADTQFVRVSRIRPDDLMEGGIDGRPIVSTTDLRTGESVRWTDSLVVLDDGSPGLIYYSTFDVQAAATYRIDVRGEEGSPTHAVTTVPSTDGIVAGIPRLNRFGDLEQTLLWLDLPRARDARINYRVSSVATGADTTFVITYAGLGQVTPRGWSIDVTLDRDHRLVRRFAESALGDTSLVLLDFSMSLESPSDEWTAVGETADIENGAGFFASVARFTEAWPLDSTIVRSIGYQTP